MTIGVDIKGRPEAADRTGTLLRLHTNHRAPHTLFTGSADIHTVCVATKENSHDSGSNMFLLLTFLVGMSDYIGRQI